MFSAVKFVVAGVIVALLGGFLLTGILTAPQNGEVAPAAVTESPSVTTNDDILPGVALTVEEVEPGVFRVADDGLGPLEYPVDPEVPYDIVAGHDGGIYIFAPGHYFRLGSGPSRGTGKGFASNIVDGLPSDVGVDPNGEIWAVFDSRIYLTPWGSGDEERLAPLMISPEPIEVTSDGTIWAVWHGYSTPWGSGRGVFGYDDGDGWTMVGEWPFDGLLRVSDQGEVWAVQHVGWGFNAIHRFVDGAWREEEGSYPNGEPYLGHAAADVGVDGTFWGHHGHPIVEDTFIRFDGTEWTTFESPDWSRTDVSQKDLAEAEGGYESDGHGRSQWGEPHVAADGSLWVSSRLGVIHLDPDRVVTVCGDGIDGIARFDGETWSRFLQGRCVEAMDIAPDGSVWLLAKESDARDVVARTYVITPEAVVATE